MGGRNKDILIILGFVLLITLPFSNKAFHIDDVAWLAVAKAILVNPSQPLHGQASLIDRDYYVFEKLGKNPRAFERLSHPPIFPYFLALVIYLKQGITERSLHIAYIFFVALAAWAAYLLAKRFTNYPLFTTLLIITSPMFMISSHSLMNDIVMLAFFCLAILTYVRGIDNDDRTQLVLSGLLIVLAILTRYIAFALIPLLIAYALLIKRKLSVSSLLPFIIALLIYGLWEAGNVMHYGGVHLLASSKFAAAYYEGATSTFKTITKNALADLSYIGGATIIPIALLFVFLSTRRRLIVFALAVIFALFGLIRGARALEFFGGYSKTHIMLFLVFFSTGLLVTYHIFEAGIKPVISSLYAKNKKLIDQHADTIFLFLWFGGMLGSSIAILPFGASRYMLPLLLPLAILFVNQIEKVFGARPRVLRLFCTFGIAFTLLSGLVLAYTDYKYAGGYRAVAALLKEKYKTETNQLWFIGDWGFRYYMERENYAYLWSRGPLPKEGDIVIKPKEAAIHDMPDDVKTCVKFRERVSVRSKNPLRILNDASHAGYYTSEAGLLPYSFSYEPIEDFYVFVIRPPNFFIKNLSEAIVEAPPTQPPSVSLWGIKGDIRLVLFEHPPSRITYKITVPEGAVLSFALALDPDVYKPGLGDGVVFKVSAKSGEDEEETLFSKYIDPKNNAGDRKWHDARVDLNAYAGKEILLSLITLPGPADNANYDLAGWGEPEIIHP
jgi:hypothetical protein